MDDVSNAASDILNAAQLAPQVRELVLIKQGLGYITSGYIVAQTKVHKPYLQLSDFAVDRQRAMREAMAATMRVQHQEDLVVHMN